MAPPVVVCIHSVFIQKMDFYQIRKEYKMRVIDVTSFIPHRVLQNRIHSKIFIEFQILEQKSKLHHDHGDCNYKMTLHVIPSKDDSHSRDWSSCSLCSQSSVSKVVTFQLESVGQIPGIQIQNTEDTLHCHRTECIQSFDLRIKTKNAAGCHSLKSGPLRPSRKCIQLNPSWNRS